MRSRSSCSVAVLSFALIAAVCVTTAAAQSGLATITGIVSDASKASLPGLSVIATNQATNVEYTGVTNEAGNYIITGVPIGSYVIKAELQGFKSMQSTVTLWTPIRERSARAGEQLHARRRRHERCDRQPDCLSAES
jgi:hypothetical protein